MMLFFQLFLRNYRLIDQFFDKTMSLTQLTGLIFLSFCLFSGLTTPAKAASNYFKEAQISDSLKKTEPANSIAWLKTGENRNILALNKPSQTSDLQGGVIILADLYQSPDWPVIVDGLRKRLPIFGWETLSVQLPVPVISPLSPEMDQLYSLTQKRIEAAISYFKNKNISNIVLIGISQSANFSIKYVESLPENSSDLQALIFIRAYDSDWLDSSNLIRNISLPTLDIIPQHDSKKVLNSAKKRLTAANFAGKLSKKTNISHLSAKVRELATNKTGNLRYRQEIINAANFQFEKQETELFKVIRGWLSVYAAGTKVTVD